MMRKLPTFLVVLVVCLLASCKPALPGDIISPGKMEDILYDYHLALAMLQHDNKGSDNLVWQETYKLAVLEKYDVSEAEFEKSMEYYMRHADLMHDIYENLAERMEEEAVAQGATASDLNQYGSLTARGDTADIWAGRRALVLTPDKPFNTYAFVVKADSAFHKGDRVMLNFKSQFIIQDGSRDAMVVFAIRYANDSISSQTRLISSNIKYTLQLSDTKNIGIKEVRGFFLFNRNSQSTKSTLKLLFLDDIQLVRMHQKDGAAPLPVAEESDEEDEPSGFANPNTSDVPRIPDEERQPVNDEPQARKKFEAPHREFGNPDQPNRNLHRRELPDHNPRLRRLQDRPVQQKQLIKVREVPKP